MIFDLYHHILAVVSEPRNTVPGTFETLGEATVRVSFHQPFIKAVGYGTMGGTSF